jgi:hypothetical protein
MSARKSWTRPVTRWALFISIPVMACDRETRSAAADSSPINPVSPSDSIVATPTRTTWDATLGPVLIVTGESPQQASIIFPNFSDSTLMDTTTFDTSWLAGMQLDLLSGAGRVGRGRLQPIPVRKRDNACVAWPDATIRIDSGGPDLTWTVAFASGSATPLPFDSLDSLTPADSARITVEVARLASTLPNDTATAFHGVPFFVRQVRRFRTASGRDVLVAHVTRRINQEANPREEQLLLIAERDAAIATGRYTPAYHERVSGHEEAIETTEVLAGLALGGRATPAVVIIRDYGDGSAYALLTRSDDGTWGVGWSSAYAGC